jgi:hypothetical protein
VLTKIHATLGVYTNQSHNAVKEQLGYLVIRKNPNCTILPLDSRNQESAQIYIAIVIFSDQLVIGEDNVGRGKTLFGVC